MNKIRLRNGQDIVTTNSIALRGFENTPEGKRLIEYDVAVVVRDCDGWHGLIEDSKDEHGNKILKYDFEDVTPLENDVPMGTLVVTKACDITGHLLPCRTVFIGFDGKLIEYNEIWIEAKNLAYVSGVQGLHLDGTDQWEGMTPQSTVIQMKVLDNK